MTAPRPASPAGRPRPTDFLDLTSVRVSRRCADAAQAHLRRVGRDGSEGFALWIGQRSGTVFTVTETLIPVQTAHHSPYGVSVSVDAAELFRINRLLYSSGQELLAQLHSHPADAYHSETDDAYPIATMAGAFSLVVPDFAVRPFSLAECAVYRLVPGQGWLHFPAPAVRRVFELFEA